LHFNGGGDVPVADRKYCLTEAGTPPLLSIKRNLSDGALEIMPVIVWDMRWPPGMDMPLAAIHPMPPSSGGVVVITYSTGASGMMWVSPGWMSTMSRGDNEKTEAPPSEGFGGGSSSPLP